MDLTRITPTTLAGIKRLAKALGEQNNVKRMQALEVAAKQAGFLNYKDAQEKLKEGRR